MNRRSFLRCLVTACSWIGAAPFAPARSQDRGIGGTGAIPFSDGDGDDRGIGGTGVIGTIRKFGSVIVNGLEVGYGADVAVRIDGVPAAPADLRIGQVVRLVAGRTESGLSTHQIDVSHEVVGPISTRNGRRMTVLGQTIYAPARSMRFGVGQTIAVSGLRRNDGTIVASLIEPSVSNRARVAGPLDLSANGTPRIGALALSGVDPALIGRRAVVDGTIENGSFVTSTAIAEATLLPDVRTFSIETYVERRGSEIATGSGFAVAPNADFASLPASRSVLAILSADLGSDGRLELREVQADGQVYGNRVDTQGRRGELTSGGNARRGIAGSGRGATDRAKPGETFGDLPTGHEKAIDHGGSALPGGNNGFGSAPNMFGQPGNSATFGGPGGIGGPGPLGGFGGQGGGGPGGLPGPGR